MSKLKDSEKRGKRAVYLSETAVSFFGYSILPGAEIVDVEGDMSLCLGFKICNGSYDQLLFWPFQKEIHFNVLHSCSNGEEIARISNTAYEDEQCLDRRGMHSTEGIAVEMLEANGYITNDKIFVRIEALP